MKNSFILTLFVFFFHNFAFSDSFIFETKNLKIFGDNKKIITGSGKATSLDKNIEILAENFEYEKDLKKLYVKNNGILNIKSDNLKIKFDKGIFDQKNLIIKLDGNIKINQIDKKITIETNKIIVDQKKRTVKSNSETLIKDNLGNVSIADNFIYELEKNILKVNNLISRDSNNSILKTAIAFINTDTKRIFGKDTNIILDKSKASNNHLFRFKGNSVKHTEEITEITKGVFTTCKKRENSCPPWELSSEKIKHNKKDKLIEYNKALLKIYNLPVLYFPKFFHPDPTVKRQTGFLIPSLSNSKEASIINTPYFIAISENKDLTLSPRIYSDNKQLIQTEYRQANKKSDHIADISFFKEKDKKNKNHFFYEFKKIFNLSNFQNNNFNLKLQKTSNDTYLKKNKIKSKILADQNLLENSLNLDLFSNNFSININTFVYENLNKNKNDRYEYILPQIIFNKEINNKTFLDGDFVFESENLIRQYDTNVSERYNINNLIFKSYPKISNNGLYNDYEFMIKNSNTDSKNSNNYKNKNNFYLSSIFQYNTSFPLIKENENLKKIIKPKASFKISPSFNKDISRNSSKIDSNNIFLLNRISEKDSLEGGVSLAYGINYLISDKKNNQEYLDFNISNNLRFEKEDDLPKTNQINNKTSNIFTKTTLKPSNHLTFKHESAIKNNLKDLAYENLNGEFKINNLINNFDYLNDNSNGDKTSYITISSKYSFNNSNSLSFSTRENKTEDLTEFYKLMYEYKNDCLAASIEYNKDFYSDRDIKPEENVLFKLTIIPFGETTSPNLLKND